MRLLLSLLGVVVVAVAAVLLTLFALENTQVVGLSFLGAHFSGNIWWLVLGAAAIGFVLGLILLAPGHMVASSRAYNLSQLNAQHEQDLASLQDAHTQLQAERDRMTAQHAGVANELRTMRDDLVAARSDRDEARRERDQLRSERDQMQGERDQLRERLAASPAEAPTTANGSHPAVAPALMAAAPAAAAMADRPDRVADQPEAGREDQDDRVVTSGAPAEPLDSTEQPVETSPATDREDQVVAREPAVTQPAQPTLGERLRAMVTGQPVDEAQAQDARQDEMRADTQTEEPVTLASPPAEAQPAEDREVTDRTAAEPANDGETAVQAPADAARSDDRVADRAETTDTRDIGEPSRETAHEAQAEEQPTLGERLRSLFTEPRHDEAPPEQPAESPEQPTA